MSTKVNNESTPSPFNKSVFAQSLYTSPASLSTSSPPNGSPRTPESSGNKRNLYVTPQKNQQEEYSSYSNKRNGLDQLVTPPNAAVSCTSSLSSSSANSATSRNGLTTPNGSQQIPTGSWSHPALQEVQRARQRRGSPQYSLWRVFMNGVAYIVYVWLSQISIVSDTVRELMIAIIGPSSNGNDTDSATEWKAVGYLNTGLQWLLILNICDASVRLFWAVQSTLQNGDDDILVKEPKIRESLTPTQRRLLGLRPSPKSAERNATSTNGQQKVQTNNKQPAAITPPRYAKTSPQTRPRPRVSPVVKGIPSPNNVTETGFDTTLVLNSSSPSLQLQQQRLLISSDGDKSLMLKGNIDSNKTNQSSSTTLGTSSSPLSSFTTSNRYRYMASNRRAANYI